MALNLTAPAASFLQRHHVMTLATQGADGPWAAAVFYAVDGQDLVFLSAPASRHGRDLAAQPRCAASIQDQETDWRAIQGIQLEASARQLRGLEAEAAQRVYAERFAFVRPGQAPPEIANALAHVQWYRLRIARLYFIDNASGLGRRQEFGHS